MEGAYTLRDYQEGDFPALMSLWEATSLSNIARGDDDNSIRKTLAHGGKLILLLDQADIIGSSWITNDGRRLYLHHFGIHPDYQGKGLSHLLAKASMEWARSHKMQIKLEVHRENTVARDLYLKYGFRYLGDYDVYIIRDPERIGHDQPL
jgi:[ribosomal protein S18]-alanine N-acetyltransferase